VVDVVVVVRSAKAALAVRPFGSHACTLFLAGTSSSSQDHDHGLPDTNDGEDIKLMKTR